MSYNLNHLDLDDPGGPLAPLLSTFMPANPEHLELDIPGQLPAPHLQGGPRSKPPRDILGWMAEADLDRLSFVDSSSVYNASEPTESESDYILQGSPLHHYMQHLKEWAHGHSKVNKITTFRGCILPHKLNYECSLDRPVLCYLRPLDTDQIITICIKLSRCKDKDGETDAASYSMVVKAGDQWEREEEWFGRQDAAQRKRQEPGYVPQLTKPSLKSPDVSGLEDGAWITICPPFPFMRLPVELRDYVLAFAMDLLPEYEIGGEREYYEDMDAEEWEDEDSDDEGPSTYKPRPSLKLLLVNRQVHNEAARLVFSETSYRINGESALRRFLLDVGEAHRRRLRKIVFQVESPIWPDDTEPVDAIRYVTGRFWGAMGHPTDMVKPLQDLSLVEFTIILKAVPFFGQIPFVIHLRSDIEEPSSSMWTTMRASDDDDQPLIAYGSLKQFFTTLHNERWVPDSQR